MSETKQKVEMTVGELDATRNEEIFYFISDIHKGNQKPDDIIRERLLLKYLEKRPKSHIFIAGDYINSAQFGHIPEIKPPTLEEELTIFRDAFSPVFSQITGITQGNHESKVFREPAGKGSLPDLITGSFSIGNDVKDKNPNAIIAPLQCGIHLNVNTITEQYHFIIDHGTRFGMQADRKELDEYLGLYNDISVIDTGHTHAPALIPRMKVNPDKSLNRTWFIRNPALTSWSPYAELHKLPPSPIGIVKLVIKNGKIKSPEFVFPP